MLQAKVNKYKDELPRSNYMPMEQKRPTQPISHSPENIMNYMIKDFK